MRGELNEFEQKLANVLRPFGWTCSDNFWDRYYRDPWVFNLANALERVVDRNHELEVEIEELKHR